MDETKVEKKFFEELRLLRENNNIDLHEIAEKTKINIKYLKLIEKGDFDALPDIYVRLFIRSYAIFLGADPKLTLIEYDKHTNIIPRNIFKKKLKTKKIDSNQTDPRFLVKNNSLQKDKKETLSKIKPLNKTVKKIDEKNNQHNNFDIQKYFYSPANILKTIVGFLFIIGVYLIISFLSREQSQKVNINLETVETTIEDQIEDRVLDNSLLTNNDFSKNRLLSKKNHRVRQRITIPYVFQIVTKEKTKMSISHDSEDGIRISDLNKIVSKDSLLKFENKNSIYFDLWNAQHVEISINNKPISKYLGEDQVLVRGSFEPINKDLYLEFYSY